MVFWLPKPKIMEIKIVLLFIIFIVASCAIIKESLLPEDELFITRKYVSNFIEYRHTCPERFGDPHIIWIKTTMKDTYGKISAYSRDCKFIEGEMLYIRRIYINAGVGFSYWSYQIESNDPEKYYTLS